MTEFTIDNYKLARECEALGKNIVDEIIDENPDDEPERLRDDVMDRVHETVDGHSWVIYTHKAILLCAHCDVSDGEAFVEDVGMSEPVTFGGLATQIAYGEMRARVEREADDELEARQEAYEAAQDEADEDEDGDDLVLASLPK